jgi:hypothetical protein
MLLCTSEVAQLSEVVVQARAGRLRLQQRGCREVRCTAEVAALWCGRCKLVLVARTDARVGSSV